MKQINRGQTLKASRMEANDEEGSLLLLLFFVKYTADTLFLYFLNVAVCVCVCLCLCTARREVKTPVLECEKLLKGRRKWVKRQRIFKK